MKIIEVVADAGHVDTLLGIAQQHEAVDAWAGPAGEDGRVAVRMLVAPDARQNVIDALQSILGAADARIVILPVEATLPAPKAGEKPAPAGTTREELYSDIERGARLDLNFLLLVFLSTIVASVGLLEDSVAIVVGAMVIAPLLGPNLGLALGTSLGDTQLVVRSLRTNFAGLGLAVGLSVLIGLFWELDYTSAELMARTVVGLDSIILALASGAAAVLSLTTGLSTALVGVMVAVALMPPAATLGMMLGAGRWDFALSAGLLLAVNIVCVNLAAKVVFLFKGVRPRTWLAQRKARQSMLIYGAFWLISLLVLLGAIVLRHRFGVNTGAW
ncbi:TIGR00341 family protein [Ectothiorhodospiraceae bacterium 2226]|nr:TIGR00341 family protein [Ectothiorhodospiraceae bacterium 2226]